MSQPRTPIREEDQGDEASGDLMIGAAYAILDRCVRTTQSGGLAVGFGTFSSTSLVVIKHYSSIILTHYASVETIYVEKVSRS